MNSLSEKPDFTESDVIDLRQIFQVLKKWRLIIIAITVLAVVTSGIMSYYVIKPVYEARAMLLVTMPVTTQQSAQNTDNLESVISTMSRLPQMTMSTYVSQLTSDTMYGRVAKKLDLDEQGYSAKSLAGMVKAEVAKDSNIILLKVQHNNSHLAADVANALGDEYLDYLSERNQDQMTKSTEFLQAQKLETDKELALALDEYKVFNSDARSVEFLEKQFTTLTDDLNRYRTSIDMSMMEVKQLESGLLSLMERLGSTPETLTMLKPNPGMVETTLAQEINPLYVTLNENIMAKESELAEKVARLEATQTVVTRMQMELEILQVELSAKQIERQQMKNEITRLEETQNLLAQKVTQTQIARSIDLGGTSLLIASPALVPANPVKPNKKLNMAVALVLGLMVAVGLAFVLEFMDNTIKHPDDVQKHLGLPVIGAIPVYRESGSKLRRGLLRVFRA